MIAQATKPDTLGHGLTDSPIGLLAYVLEKYSLGTYGFGVYGKRDGNLDKLDRDELLSIVTIYWMTNTITSSIRFYKAQTDLFGATGVRNEMRNAKVSADVNVGIQQMKNELLLFPARLVQMKYPNLKQFEYVDGGHFAAFQMPLETAKNFVKFVLNSL